MQLEQNIRKRAYDGLYVVWQKMQLATEQEVLEDLGSLFGPARAARYEENWAPFERWVAAGVFRSFQDAMIFTEAQRRSAKLPLFAGQPPAETCSQTADLNA